MLKIELLYFVVTAGALLFFNRAAPQTTPAADNPAKIDGEPTIRSTARAQRRAGNFTPVTAPSLFGAGTISRQNANSNGGGNANNSAGGLGGGFAAVGNGIVGFTGGIVGMALGAVGLSASDRFHDSINSGINAINAMSPFASAFANPMRTAAMVADMLDGRASAPDKADAPSPANNFRGAGGASGAEGNGGTGDGGPGHGEGAGTGGNR